MHFWLLLLQEQCQTGACSPSDWFDVITPTLKLQKTLGTYSRNDPSENPAWLIYFIYEHPVKKSAFHHVFKPKLQELQPDLFGVPLAPN